MRNRMWSSGTRRAAIGALMAVTMVATLLAQVAQQSAAAQDDLAIQTRVIILHAAPSLGKVEVHINYDEITDEFTYGQMSEWTDFQPGAARVTITMDRAGFNYAIFDAVYPAPAGNDYYLVISDALVLAGTFDRNPVPDGGARVVVLQASVALPAVNVKATSEESAWATQLGYGRTSEAATVPAGTYDVEVALADSGDVAVTAPGIALDGNTSNVLVVMGEPNDTDHPLEVRQLTDTTEERSGTPTP